MAKQNFVRRLRVTLGKTRVCTAKKKKKGVGFQGCRDHHYTFLTQFEKWFSGQERLVCKCET